jgi:hypothetical protein
MTCGCGGIGCGCAAWYCFTESCSGSLLEPPPPPPQQNQMLQEMLLQEKVKLGHAEDMLYIFVERSRSYLGQVLFP